MEKELYKMKAEYGRMGILEGLFISPKKYVDILIEKQIEVYFGEVLGKHSEVYGTMDADDFEVVSDDLAVIEVVEKHNLTNGINPFHYTINSFDFEENNIKPDKDYGYDDMSVGEVVKQLIEMGA